MQILARPKNTTSKTAFILYINVLEHWNRIKNGLVSKVDFEHPTLKAGACLWFYECKDNIFSWNIQTNHVNCEIE